MLNLQLVQAQVSHFLLSLRNAYGAQHRVGQSPGQIKFEVELYSMSSRRILITINITPNKISVSVVDAAKRNVFSDSFTDDINSHNDFIAAIRAQAEK